MKKKGHPVIPQPVPLGRNRNLCHLEEIALINPSILSDIGAMTSIHAV